MLFQSFGCVEMVGHLRVAVERTIEANQLTTVGACRTTGPNVFGLFHKLCDLCHQNIWEILANFGFLPLFSPEC